ncbi:MAG: GDYXXLXY domain-containing protein, partial [Dehalococcoidia bacterium]|nr:GDYXXLXY domain-containing protein [Dehalococcoidia bacterium]
VAALSLQAGVTFLAAGALGGAGALAQDMSGFLAPRAVLNPRVALGLALGTMAVAALARAWPEVRRPPVLAAGAVLAALAWLQPLAGALMLLSALAAASGRRALAAAAALGWAWVIGAAYYALAWPLTTKAAVLAGAGAVLGASAWIWARNTTDARLAGHGPGTAAASEQPAPLPPAPASRLGAAAVALGTVATLAVAGGAIWQKERLIAGGRPVFLELAP